MEIDRRIIKFITFFSIIIILLLDIINITKYIKFQNQLESTISNTITFISILIGFISSIYVMIVQNSKSLILQLLKKNNLMIIFNKNFKSSMYCGFIDVILLILMNFSMTNLTIIHILPYLIIPLTLYFLLTSNNMIATICKIIIADDEIQQNKVIEEENIKKELL